MRKPERPRREIFFHFDSVVVLLEFDEVRLLLEALRSMLGIGVSWGSCSSEERCRMGDANESSKLREAQLAFLLSAPVLSPAEVLETFRCRSSDIGDGLIDK